MGFGVGDLGMGSILGYEIGHVLSSSSLGVYGYMVRETFIFWLMGNRDMPWGP